ncbi:predicted protein [Arabidopsis lyrata subsp. lyrata]|uniref:Predicted protein n=1 Tax=Arabidopsis lyrata subsp. lyrata TaxID=81972 RepID=D7LR90_ARALL|nr:predicted protein [Arabidopsis lyrata subsp. lyrata]
MISSLGGLKGSDRALLMLACEAVSIGKGVLVVKPDSARLQMMKEISGYVWLLFCKDLQAPVAMENARISISESERKDPGNCQLGLAIVLVDLGTSCLGLLVLGGRRSKLVLFHGLSNRYNRISNLGVIRKFIEVIGLWNQLGNASAGQDKFSDTMWMQPGDPGKREVLYLGRCNSHKNIKLFYEGFELELSKIWE